MRKPVPHPIWTLLRRRGVQLKTLAEQTGYSYSHVCCIKSGFWSATPRFRARCARFLSVPEAELFLPDDTDYIPPRRRAARERKNLNGVPTPEVCA